MYFKGSYTLAFESFYLIMYCNKMGYIQLKFISPGFYVINYLKIMHLPYGRHHSSIGWPWPWQHLQRQGRPPLSAVLLKAQKAGHILKWLLSLTSTWVDQCLSLGILSLFASAFPHWRGGFTGGMRGVALCAVSEQGSEGIRAPTDTVQGQLLYSIYSCLLALSRPIDFNSEVRNCRSNGL